MNNFIVIVLDGLGIGELPDANIYNDGGSHTFKNIALYNKNISLPNLEKMGLGKIDYIPGISSTTKTIAAYGKMSELAPGKDSTTGHWELGGLKITKDFPYFPDGFPQSLVDKFIKETKINGILGNYAASGTEIIKELGQEHIKTKNPIVYTSADSVFQIAVHTDIIPLERLYELCQIAREKVLIDEYSVGRVIARPFIGEFPNFKRTTDRKDYSLDPFGDTILDVLIDNGIKTIAVGKINDLFNHRGISLPVKTKSNDEGIEKTIQCIKYEKNSFIFTNLVDFDVYYGHRLDPIGFYNALKEFDKKLPDILNAMDETDYLILTADHGNDPTVTSTDHTREYVPVLFYNQQIKSVDLGISSSFADVAQTVADFFKINNNLLGKSFFEKI